jgi:RimJ/RimL family protein N-acetyltransferase
MTPLRLRPSEPADNDALFEWMRDPEAVALAAFTAADPDDREAFDRWRARNLANPTIVDRMIDVDGVLVGTIYSWAVEGEREISYWIDREHWGRGYATAALQTFLNELSERPLYGQTAAHNVGSARVLEGAGFAKVGTERGYANGVGAEIECHTYRLD